MKKIKCCPGKCHGRSKVTGRQIWQLFSPSPAKFCSREVFRVFGFNQKSIRQTFDSILSRIFAADGFKNSISTFDLCLVFGKTTKLSNTHGRSVGKVSWIKVPQKRCNWTAVSSIPSCSLLVEKILAVPLLWCNLRSKKRFGKLMVKNLSNIVNSSSLTRPHQPYHVLFGRESFCRFGTWSILVS